MPRDVAIMFFSEVLIDEGRLSIDALLNAIVDLDTDGRNRLDADHVIDRAAGIYSLTVLFLIPLSECGLINDFGGFVEPGTGGERIIAINPGLWDHMEVEGDLIL